MSHAPYLDLKFVIKLVFSLKCFSDANDTVGNLCRTIYISNENDHVLLINKVICIIIIVFYVLVWSNVPTMDL